MEIYVMYRRKMYNDFYTLYFTFPETVDHSLSISDRVNYFKYCIYENNNLEEYEVPDLSTLTEEQYFQLECVWEHSISTDIMSKMQELLKHNISTGKSHYDDNIKIG